MALQERHSLLPSIDHALKSRNMHRLLRDVSAFTRILKSSNIIRLFVSTNKVSQQLREFQVRVSNLSRRLQVSPFNQPNRRAWQASDGGPLTHTHTFKIHPLFNNMNTYDRSMSGLSYQPTTSERLPKTRYSSFRRLQSTEEVQKRLQVSSERFDQKS